MTTLTQTMVQLSGTSKMKEIPHQSFDDSYFDSYLFDFDVRYPFFYIIAATLVEQYNPNLVLDLGCGKGHLVYAFNELGIESFGVDGSDYAINHSPESIKTRLFKADLAFETIPFGKEKFEIVTALGLLEHLENLDHIICEIKRVLQPNGILFIRTPNRYIEMIYKILGISDPTHINVRPKAYWVKTLSVNGFEHVGEFSRAKHREAMCASYSQKHVIIKALNANAPTTNSGRILLKFGKAGKWLRGELAAYPLLLPPEAMLFKLQ